MDRRHFLQLNGASLSSLLFSNWTTAFVAGPALVQLPMKVLVRLDDGLHELRPNGARQTWSYQEVAVELRYEQDVLRVQVRAPGQALHAVQLQWRYAAPAGATVLGDAWERTYGDVAFRPSTFDRKLPWYFVQHEPRTTTCFGVKTRCNTLCYWQVGAGAMQLTLNTESGGVGVQLGNRTLHAATVVATQRQGQEDAFATARRFCGLLCPTPRLPQKPVYGINDWYFAYGNNSAPLILEHTAMLAKLATNTDNRPFSVIDAGWATYAPALPGDGGWQDDFTRSNQKFGDMSQLAGQITQLGMRPGLWTRPLCAAHDTARNRLLPAIPGRDDPRKPVLDPTIPENLAHVEHLFRTYQAWQYELVKHDFTTYDLLGRWGFEMTDRLTPAGWRFSDNTRTTAEIINQLYQTIRQAAGPTYLIGCNTVSHLSAGVFELCRTGDDTSGQEWDRTRKMGVNTLGFRLVQHNRFYAADGDCVGLTTKIPWAKNKQWLRLLAESGSPLFISAQKEALGTEQQEAIRRSFAQAATVQPVGEPLDWLTNPWPAQWRLDGNVTTFEWT